MIGVLDEVRTAAWSLAWAAVSARDLQLIRHRRLEIPGVVEIPDEHRPSRLDYQAIVLLTACDHSLRVWQATVSGLDLARGES